MKDFLKAVQRNDLLCTKKMLDRVKRQEWVKAFEWTEQHERTEMLDLLLSHGAMHGWNNALLVNACEQGLSGRVGMIMNFHSHPQFQLTAIDFAIGGGHIDVLNVMANHPNMVKYLIPNILITHLDTITTKAFGALLDGYDLKDDICEVVSITSMVERDDLIDVLYPRCTPELIDEVCDKLVKLRPSSTFYIQRMRQSQLQHHELSAQVDGAQASIRTTPKL